MSLSEAGSVVAEIERADDLDVLRRIVQDYAGRLGYDRLILYSATPGGKEVVDRIYWLEGDWFGEGRRVDAQTYLERCPITRYILETDAPFFWSKSGKAGKETYRIVRRP